MSAASIPQGIEADERVYMKKQNLIEQAKEYARKAHVGQKDDSGLPYFDIHLRQVADIVSKVTIKREIIAAAWLHDTLEDTKATLYELKEQFGPEVALLVYELTHEGDKVHGYYFPRLKSRDAILIKFADRLSNLSRMEFWPEKRRQHYLKKSVFWKSDRG